MSELLLIKEEYMMFLKVTTRSWNCKIAFCYICLLLSLYGNLHAEQLQERTQIIMGTFVTLKLPVKKTQAFSKSFALLKNIDAKLSSFKDKSDISRLNRLRRTKISILTYKALQQSLQYYQATEGYFDITIGSISKKLYRFGEKERVPNITELNRAIVNIRGLHFSKEYARVDQDVNIDLGGMGKGFGVDAVAAYLRAQNIHEGVIALSGDIRCLGICKLAIQDPFSEGVMMRFTNLQKDMGISTSGNYRRYVGSKKNNHLINPKRHRSEYVFASITLISHKSNAMLDAYATAVSVMPLEKAEAFLQREALGYVLITTAGKVIKSKNLKTFIRESK